MYNEFTDDNYVELDQFDIDFLNETNATNNR